VEDWKSNRLSVATLLEMNLRKNSPFLAYLSACGTGRINDDKFVDESVHLISACQLAGFRHVIGTLWEVNDEFCVDMARNTYQAMRDGGMTDESVSSGLHKATRELRDQCVKLSSIARNGGKQVDLVDKKLDALNLSDGDRRDVEPHRDVLCDEDRGHAKLPRDILPDDDNDDGDDGDIDPLHWVPYVHYGV
jgi:CHAT domain-containing protein